MRKSIEEGVLRLAARELGVERKTLTENAFLKPEGWYHIALLCDVWLVTHNFVHWTRPTHPKPLRDIIEAIHTHNKAHRLHHIHFSLSFDHYVEA